MIEIVRKYPVQTIAVIAFYYTVGIFGLSIPKSQPLFQALVPFTLLCSLYFLWLFQENLNMKVYLTGLAIFVLGFLVEVAGVNTGVIFGEYEYGRTLGIKLWSTPLMIGVNWLLLIFSCRALTELYIRNRWLRIVAASLLMVIYDIVLEPVAIRLDMWNWFGEQVPLQNYLAWFVVSLILFFILEYFVKQVRNKIAPSLFIVQLAFFLVLNIVYKLS
jgi:putative membrane protein